MGHWKINGIPACSSPYTVGCVMTDDGNLVSLVCSCNYDQYRIMSKALKAFHPDLTTEWTEDYCKGDNNDNAYKMLRRDNINTEAVSKVMSIGDEILIDIIKEKTFNDDNDKTKYREEIVFTFNEFDPSDDCVQFIFKTIQDSHKKRWILKDSDKFMDIRDLIKALEEAANTLKDLIE